VLTAAVPWAERIMKKIDNVFGDGDVPEHLLFREAK